ncbi:GMC family oxidoreductase N-terminal domain-containing protein [Kitasatospora sp. YST-16]|uniref:GMC family oxidoreductase n=1 Tax=Kitasatospora sp. YST-16 TaxID=2998080 RepID=UPI0022840CCC|nr:GMC family oxidoreductase N-terminal domain-containing protein [Kitasatospora sp. YST-16]WAL73582.1 GMC family oxidoreductase N-terminal domain-containing protein [Kitasatospora sp. YST-16]WNW39639.1 GMC family oxidoreductase N-terminal domain-containing protein [Streptomyces sp. Li-HN-5-13]
MAADYVVVGAGSAGAAVAARLSEDGSADVVLLEAGGWPGREELHRTDAGALLELLTADWSTAVDWGYATEPEPGVDGRRIPVARGRLAGGCSAVNALMWVRGSRRDYDGWRDLGNPGWGYRDVLPHFRRSEDYAGGASAWRGAGGPVQVAAPAEPTPLAEAFVAAARETGHGGDGDYNAEHQEGFGFHYQHTRTPRGRRSSTATGYLRPALARPNLTVQTGAQATRILVEDGRAVGVEYLQGDRTHTLRATREVVVCAGAFESPKLLLLSGIGPADQLRAAGVEVLLDLPGVGRNLQDHLFAPVCYESLRELPPGAPLSEAGLFTRTAAADPARGPDLQFTFGPVKFLPADAPAALRAGPGFTFAPIALLPASRGTVTLRDTDPRSTAVVRPGYLSDPADLDVLVEGVRLARELARTAAFDDFRGEEYGPGKGAVGTAELRAYVRANATTLWHPAGTCRMGPGPDAVVGPDLRVHGIDGLRVADASVMPTVVAGNTNAPSVMIGEKAADLILNRP